MVANCLFCKKVKKQLFTQYLIFILIALSNPEYWMDEWDLIDFKCSDMQVMDFIFLRVG